MGGRQSTHDWKPQLQSFCSEYEEVEDKVTPKEVLRGNVLMASKKIGKGTFGSVTKCSVKGEPTMANAICKKFKNVPKEIHAEIFLGVAQMAQLGEALHVVRLLGAVTMTSQLESSQLLILEFCECGSLDLFLKQRIGMGTADKLDVLMQVADGMAELEGMNFVHRNLSAQNVLVAEGGHNFKVSDWGRRGTDPQYQAIEVIKKELYSHHSDAWAFGMLVTVVFDDGTQPFPDTWTDEQVTDRVMGGYTPKKKRDCPDDMFEIVTQCWSKTPAERPEFYWLRGEFEDKAEAAKAKLHS